LPEYLKRSANDLLHQRERKSRPQRHPKTSPGVKKHLREVLTRELGGFPERTPAQSKVTASSIAAPTRSRKIFSKSHREFYVTANLYVPKPPAAVSGDPVSAGP